MFLEALPYLFCGAIALFGTILYRRLSRSTKITKDKVAGITVSVTLIPFCLAVLIIVLQVDAHFDWILVIIVALPLIVYFIVPIRYRWFILPQLELMEKAKKNKKLNLYL